MERDNFVMKKDCQITNCVVMPVTLITRTVTQTFSRNSGLITHNYVAALQRGPDVTVQASGERPFETKSLSVSLT